MAKQLEQCLPPRTPFVMPDNEHVEEVNMIDDPNAGKKKQPNRQQRRHPMSYQMDDDEEEDDDESGGNAHGMPGGPGGIQCQSQ